MTTDFAGSGCYPPKRPIHALLIIADDDDLLQFFKREIQSRSFQRQIVVDYRYSCRNGNPGPMIAAGLTVIDLSDESTIQTISSRYDLILSLHCFQIFPRKLVERIRCINIHPGFNPYNRGMHPYVFSIVTELPAGATIHLMGSRIDHGDIIAQKKVEVLPSDTSLEVLRKSQDAEKELIRVHLESIIEANYDHAPPSSTGSINSFKDYEALCELDLAHTGTLKEHINRLRATTWGSRYEGHFVGADGKKYLVGVVIEQVPPR